jgi:hypothetical protein
LDALLRIGQPSRLNLPSFFRRLLFSGSQTEAKAIFADPVSRRLEPNNDDRSEVLRLIWQLDDRLARLQINPVLDNFTGFISVHVRTAGDGNLPVEECKVPAHYDDATLVTVNGVRVSPAQNYEIAVQFVVNEETDVIGYLDPINIQTGNVTEIVTFDVVLVYKDITFSHSRASSTFRAKSGSEPLTFVFEAPQGTGNYELFIEVLQKNRLLQVVPVSIIVATDAR